MRGRNGGNQGEAEDFLIRVVFSAISFRFFVIVVFFVFSSSALTPNKFRTAGSQGFFPAVRRIEPGMVGMVLSANATSELCRKL